MGFSELIAALTILNGYGDPSSPTHCEHDELMVMIDPAIVSDDDKARLDAMGFFVNDEYECFMSYRYGSA